MAGKRTIILLESEDMALMDPQIWLLPFGILVGCLWEWMKIWYADTTIPDDLGFMNLTDRLSS